MVVFQLDCLIVILSGIAIVGGLRCKTCENINAEVTSFWGNSGSFDSDPNCEDGTMVPSESCSGTDKCYYAKFEGSGDVLFGSVTLGGVKRGCTSEALFQSNKCFDLDDQGQNVIGLAQELLTFFTSIKITGKVCYCDSDFCDAKNPCDGLFQIESFCVHVWMVAVASAAVVLVAMILLAIAFGQKKTSRGQVFPQQQNQMTIQTVQQSQQQQSQQNQQNTGVATQAPQQPQAYPPTHPNAVPGPGPYQPPYQQMNPNAQPQMYPPTQYGHGGGQPPPGMYYQPMHPGGAVVPQPQPPPYQQPQPGRDNVVQPGGASVTQPSEASVAQPDEASVAKPGGANVVQAQHGEEAQSNSQQQNGYPPLTPAETV